jgi:AraC-like DNA-binding protein/DNA gyrase inhibitor GyrI
MNAYERMQRVIEEIESRIENGQNLDGVCNVSGFSQTHCYRLFHALCGRSIAEYARQRQLSRAVSLLTGTNLPIIEIAQVCGYESQEAFTRAFRAELGSTPGKVRSGAQKVQTHEKLDLFEKYFDRISNTIYTDPKIKVIRDLPQMTVASFICQGAHPEKLALEKMYAWAQKHGILDKSYRIFGFDNPLPSKSNPEYGYEVWITVPDGFESKDAAIKLIEPRTYAIIHTVLSEIEISWRHFVKWLNLGKYEYGGGQCLEEHLTVRDDWGAKDPEFDLYMPVRPKRIMVEDRKESEMADIYETDMEGFDVATYCHRSSSPENDGWNVIGKWAKEQGLLDRQDLIVFGFDNPSPDGKNPVYGYEYWVRLPEGVDVPEPFTKRHFTGGHFACLESDVPHVGADWKRLVQWVKNNDREWAGCDCFERSYLGNTPSGDIRLILMIPVKPKQ